MRDPVSKEATKIKAPCASIGLLGVLLLVLTACSGQPSTRPLPAGAKVAGAPAKSSHPALPRETDDSQTAPRLTYEQSNGKILYHKYCAVCHGASGAGDGFNAYNLQPAVPRNFTERQAMARLTDQQIFEAIRKGGLARGLSALMPAWGTTLNERQVAYLVSYIRTLASPKSEAQSP